MKTQPAEPRPNRKGICVLAQQHRMRAKAQFSKTTRSGARSGRRNLVLYTVKTPGETTSIGFIVSKSVGNAVTRNKTKRRLRELIAPFVSEQPNGYSLVIRALPAAAHADYPQLSNDLDSALASVLKKLDAAPVAAQSSEATTTSTIQGEER
ncbi:ribonuclease P [Mycobacteroides abscessus subsp. bolletii]|nr:ribonuclease P [Mycobacteroides abscessus subsp. bolletii]